MKLIGSNSRGRLAEVLGHELRNPLASAVASISVSLEMTDAGDPRSTFLSRSLDDLMRVSTLLDSYLDLGRSGAMSRELVDLVVIARRIQDRYRGHPAVVEVESGEQPVRLSGDPVLLERLLENLVENSLSMGATQVDLHLERLADRCVLRVTDNGPGVPSELRDQLFEPFVSGRGSSGLGLALCRDVVESHGGTISLVPSVTGAVFRVSLQRLSERTSHAAESTPGRG